MGGEGLGPLGVVPDESAARTPRAPRSLVAWATEPSGGMTASLAMATTGGLEAGVHAVASSGELGVLARADHRNADRDSHEARGGSAAVTDLAGPGAVDFRPSAAGLDGAIGTALLAQHPRRGSPPGGVRPASRKAAAPYDGPEAADTASSGADETSLRQMVREVARVLREEQRRHGGNI